MDDVAVTRMLLVHLLAADPGIQVVGAVEDGQAALEFVRDNSLDIVLMDIHMPRLDGFEATRRIMETRPLPIVICTATTDPRELSSTFRLLEAGAVACVSKPVSHDHPDFDLLANQLLQTVKLMAEVKVVRRWPRSRIGPPAAQAHRIEMPRRASGGIRLIGVGASTGGPLVLQVLLSGLPRDFPVPLLIVQHIARGFLPGMIEWLSRTSGPRLQIATQGTVPQPAHVYFAPDDHHLGVEANQSMTLSRSEPLHGLRPAASHLFRSMAQHCGASSLGVLLSGMGKDGAAELKLMKDAGAHTFVQDRESSVVYGMPGEAIALDAASEVLPAVQLAPAIVARVGGATYPLWRAP